MKDKKRILLILTAVLMAVVFFVALGNILAKLFEYEKSKRNYEQLKKEHVIMVEPPAEEAQPREVAPIAVDFDKLLKENQDVVGWIYCEGTTINYPVVQAADNDYYLRRALNGKYDVCGSIFMDYRSDAGLTHRNTLIYGHNMRNKTMFSVLEQYKKQAFYDEHPVFWYLTPHGDYKIELFAGFVASADSRIYSDFATHEKLVDQSRRAIEKSTFKSSVDPEKAEQIITLSTCSYEFDEARYILLGVLKKI